jgi:hypothetical protein
MLPEARGYIRKPSKTRLIGGVVHLLLGNEADREIKSRGGIGVFDVYEMMFLCLMALVRLCTLGNF